MKDFVITQEEADEADILLVVHQDGRSRWGSQLSLSLTAATLREIADDIERKATAQDG